MVFSRKEALQIVELITFMPIVKENVQKHLSRFLDVKLNSLDFFCNINNFICFLSFFIDIMEKLRKQIKLLMLQKSSTYHHHVFLGQQATNYSLDIVQTTK